MVVVFCSKVSKLCLRLTWSFSTDFGIMMPYLTRRCRRGREDDEPSSVIFCFPFTRQWCRSSSSAGMSTISNWRPWYVSQLRLVWVTISARPLVASLVPTCQDLVHDLDNLGVTLAWGLNFSPVITPWVGLNNSSKPRITLTHIEQVNSHQEHTHTHAYVLVRQFFFTLYSSQMRAYLYRSWCLQNTN